MRNILPAFLGICIGLPLSLYTHPFTVAIEVSEDVESPVYEDSEAVEVPLQSRTDATKYESDDNDYQEQVAEEEYLAELELLACVVYAEAGIEDLYGKRLVVDVVLNRVDSPRFPNTITDVIYQKNQFSTVTDGSLDRAYSLVTPECYEAVAMELEERTDSDILFFTAGGYNPYCKPAYVYQHHFFGY